MATENTDKAEEATPVVETSPKERKASKPKYDVTQEGYGEADLVGFSVTLQEVNAENNRVDRKVTVAAINWQAALTIAGYDNKSLYSIEEIDAE